MRKQVLRRRRIHTSFAEKWEAFKNKADQVREESKKPVIKPA